MRTFSAAVFIVVLLPWMPLPSSAGEAQRSAPTLEFDLLRDHEGGLLIAGQAFVLSVRLTDWKSTREEELVAVFESPAFPMRLLPLMPDGASADYAASVVFEPHPFVVGMTDQALRIEVAVARLRGMRLEPVLKRTVYLTVGAPPPPADAASAPAPAAAPPNPVQAPVASADPIDNQGQPMLPPEEVQEEDLGGSPPAVQSPAYWRSVRELLGRRWQHQLAQLEKSRASHGLRVRFRLYAGGLAQLIQVERSSGDPKVDEAGLRAVLRSLPFPPFPLGVRESSVEVHLDLPAARR